MYVRGLQKYIQQLGFKIVHHEYLWFSHPNNENPIITAEKNANSGMQRTVKFVSPISKKLLKKHKNFLFCKEDGYASPIIESIQVY